MPEQLKVFPYTMLAGGATKTFDVKEKFQIYQLIPDGGAITLLGNLTIDAVGTPTEGMKYTFEYGGSVTAGAFSVTIFSKVLSTKEALAEYTITCFYTNAAWEVKLLQSSNNGSNPSVDGSTIQDGTIASASMDSSGVALTSIEDAPGQGYMITSDATNAPQYVDFSSTGVFPIGDGTDVLPVLMSGDATMDSLGAVSIANNAITTQMLNFGLSGVILEATLTLTEAQILALNTTPIQIIPAPSATEYIAILEATAEIETYAGSPYNTNLTLGLVNTTAGESMRQEVNLLGSTATKMNGFVLNAGGSGTFTQTIKGEAVLVRVRNADPLTAGTGSSIIVRVSYIVKG